MTVCNSVFHSQNRTPLKFQSIVVEILIFKKLIILRKNPILESLLKANAGQIFEVKQIEKILPVNTINLCCYQECEKLYLKSIQQLMVTFLSI